MTDPSNQTLRHSLPWSSDNFLKENAWWGALLREQDGRLHASSSALGRISCKRERYEATEPVCLIGEYCISLICWKLLHLCWHARADQSSLHIESRANISLTLGIWEMFSKANLRYARTSHHIHRQVFKWLYSGRFDTLDVWAQNSFNIYNMHLWQATSKLFQAHSTVAL